MTNARRSDVRDKARRNPTTRTGQRVHEGNRSGYPLCGAYVRGIHYTDETPNCSRCSAALARIT